MPDLVVGPCSNYVSDEEVLACDDTLDAERVAIGAAVATRVMYLATGRQFLGTCTETVRPCGCQSCCGGRQVMPWGTVLWPGTTDCGGCCDSGPCGCGGADSIDLGLTPLQTVTEVLVDGVALVEGTDYRVDDWRYLIRLDGESWPACQNMALATTEEGTWSATVGWGLGPSALVVEGTRALAVEIAKACNGGDATCKLSPRVVSQTRQGTSIDLLDPQDFLIANPNGGPRLTGVYLADLAITQENPSGLVADGVFINPDCFGPKVRRTGTQAAGS